MLAELQLLLRDALVSGNDTGIAALLVGGCAAERRLQVHQRHYETSLVTALLGKFPATQWLTGSVFMTEAARQFVRLFPPSTPCIAEYGGDFPRFLAECPLAERMPYLRSFSELEWHVGHVSIAIELTPLPIASLSTMDIDSILAARLSIQPGVCYFETRWPLDELFTLCVTETEPDRFSLDPSDVLLEIRGTRGDFRLNRLAAGDFAFRRAIAGGRTTGAAAESALEADTGFDVGAAFVKLFAEGLVVSVAPPSEQPR